MHDDKDISPCTTYLLRCATIFLQPLLQCKSTCTARLARQVFLRSDATWTLAHVKKHTSYSSSSKYCQNTLYNSKNHIFVFQNKSKHDGDYVFSNLLLLEHFYWANFGLLNFLFKSAIDSLAMSQLEIMIFSMSWLRVCLDLGTIHKLSNNNLDNIWPLPWPPQHLICPTLAAERQDLRSRRRVCVLCLRVSPIWIHLGVDLGIDGVAHLCALGRMPGPAYGSIPAYWVSKNDEKLLYLH